MEILIIVAIWSVVVKRGVEDILHSARGGTPPRLAAAKARRQTGAAGRYWQALRDDTFDDMLQRHNQRRARRAEPQSPSVARPRGAATQFLANRWSEATAGLRRSWRSGWTRLDEKAREKSTRPRPGQDTVPGEVVPNARPQDEDQDETQDGPQDEAGPDPKVVQDEDGRTDLKFGDDPADPTGTKTCPECKGTGLVDGEVCLSCRDRQEQRNQHHDSQPFTGPCPGCGKTSVIDPNPGHPPNGVCADCWKKANGYTNPDQTTTSLASNTTQEGTTMTATTTEIMGLDSALTFCDQVEQQFTTQVSQHDSNRAKTAQVASAYRSLANVIDSASAAIANGGVTGETATQLATAMEQANAAAADMDAATLLFTSAQEKAGLAAAAMATAQQELQGHKGIQEQYNSNPGAGTREFVTAGQ